MIQRLVSLAEEGTVCTLPDAAATSKCTRLHYCTSLFEYAKNIRGRPTPADEAHIGKYSCAMKVRVFVSKDDKR